MPGKSVNVPTVSATICTLSFNNIGRVVVVSIWDKQTNINFNMDRYLLMLQFYNILLRLV